MVKIPSPRRLFRSRSKSTGGRADICAMVAEHEKIEWEVRPGGMLVQKWRAPEEDDDMAGAVDVIQCAADLLIEVYKTTLNKMGGYIVNTDKVKDKHAAYLKVSRLEKFFHELSMCEEKIFLKRNELREKFQHNISHKAAENERRERNSDNLEESPDGPDLMAMSSSTQCSISTCSSDKSDVGKSFIYFCYGVCFGTKIRLGLPGWKSRFYKEKFGVETSNEVGNLRNVMVQKYLEGLCWVFQYYFAGVPSWSWYYPFYYAPFASDLKGLSRFNISFTVGKPLRPFDQLMTVLPPERSCALPKCYSKLMGCEESSIRKFYPSEVEIDTDGKRFFWQGIVKLPFIDEELLLSATKAVEKELALEEAVEFSGFEVEAGGAAVSPHRVEE